MHLPGSRYCKLSCRNQKLLSFRHKPQRSLRHIGQLHPVVPVQQETDFPLCLFLLGIQIFYRIFSIDYRRQLLVSVDHTVLRKR